MPPTQRRHESTLTYVPIDELTSSDPAVVSDGGQHWVTHPYHGAAFIRTGNRVVPFTGNPGSLEHAIEMFFPHRQLRISRLQSVDHAAAARFLTATARPAAVPA